MHRWNIDIVFFWHRTLWLLQLPASATYKASHQCADAAAIGTNVDDWATTAQVTSCFAYTAQFTQIKQ